MGTRNTIMDVAEDAVRKRGYNGFSLDQIARDVGIQKSSIYYHFSSKSAMIAEIFKRFSGQIFSFLERIENTEERAGDRLIAYIAESRALAEEGESICLAIALNVDRQCLHAEIVDDLALFHQTNIDWLTNTFELGVIDGSIGDVGNPGQEASACFALVDGALLTARAHRDAKLYDEATCLLRSRIFPTAPNDITH